MLVYIRHFPEYVGICTLNIPRFVSISKLILDLSYNVSIYRAILSWQVGISDLMLDLS